MTGNYTGSTPDDYDDDGREPDDADQVVTSTDQQIIEAVPDGPKDDDDESSVPPVLPIPTSGAEAAAGAAGAAGAVGGVVTPDSPEVDPNAPDEETPAREAETPDTSDSVDVQEDTSGDDQAESESEDEDRDDDQDEETDLEFTLVHFTDPLCVLSWQAEPILKRLEVRYGHALEIERRLVPVREFDAPEAMADRWASVAESHGMPVNTEIWATAPPQSTAPANSAYLAATEQGDQIAQTYLRRLWRAGFTEVADLTDREVLLTLAEEVGLNTHQMAQRMDEVTPDWSDESVRTPQFRLDVLDAPGPWTSYPGEEIEVALLGAGVTPRLPPTLTDFVADYGPVTTWEVMVVYEYDRNTAREELSELERQDKITSIELAGSRFWEGR